MKIKKFNELNENFKTDKRDLDFNPISLDVFESWIKEAREAGYTDITVSYEQDEYPFIEFSKSEQKSEMIEDEVLKTPKYNSNRSKYFNQFPI